MLLCYESVLAAIQTVLPDGVPTQLVNLARLVRAFLLKCSCTLREVARAYPPAPTRRRPAPKHDLHYRLRRLDRFLSHPRFDPLAGQCAFIPALLACLNYPHHIGVAVDWTRGDSRDRHGQRGRDQLWRIAIPRRGRALALLQVVYNRDALPAGQRQNQLEEAALLAVVRALPLGVTPVVLAGYPCGSPEPCPPPANQSYFRPSGNVTRGQTAKIGANTFFPNCQTPVR